MFFEYLSRYGNLFMVYGVVVDFFENIELNEKQIVKPFVVGASGVILIGKKSQLHFVLFKHCPGQTSYMHLLVEKLVTLKIQYTYRVACCML